MTSKRKNLILSEGVFEDKAPGIEAFVIAIHENRATTLVTPKASYVFMPGDGVLSTGILSKTEGGKDWLYDRKAKLWKEW